MAEARKEEKKKLQEVANSSSCKNKFTNWTLNLFRIHFPLENLRNCSQVQRCTLYKRWLSKCPMSHLPRKVPQQDTGEFIWNTICKVKTSSGSLNRASEISLLLPPSPPYCKCTMARTNNLAHDWQFMKQKASEMH